MHILGAGRPEDIAADKARVLILRQVDQMSGLVDDLLDITRVRSGQLKLRLARMDLCGVVAAAIRAAEGAMKQRDHRLDVSYPDAPVWLQGDAVRLEQAFVNLLMNAAKYTPQGGRISVSVTRGAGEAAVVFSDTGVGMAADLLPRVFDLYVQAAASSRKGGLGLGLPLVRALVEGHGGTVTAASAGLGLGSEFTVRLPLVLPPRSFVPQRFDRPRASDHHGVAAHREEGNGNGKPARECE